MSAPYWLIREHGSKVGCHVVDIDTAITSEAAIEAFRSMWAEKWASLLGDAPPVTARLVTLTYVDGQPVVTEVK